MRLYFWDWNDSKTIELCDTVNPFQHKQEAEDNDCFTNLESAKLKAKRDLREQIDYLNELLGKIDALNLDTVMRVKHIRGL